MREIPVSLNLRSLTLFEHKKQSMYNKIQTFFNNMPVLPYEYRNNNRYEAEIILHIFWPYWNPLHTLQPKYSTSRTA